MVVCWLVSAAVIAVWQSARACFAAVRVASPPAVPVVPVPVPVPASDPASVPSVVLSVPDVVASAASLRAASRKGWQAVVEVATMVFVSVRAADAVVY
jgi:hypothetical protein